MKNLIGKTVAEARYIDPWGRGLLLTFTDGTTLRVTERMQAGEFEVEVNNQTAEYEYNFDD